jgi:hypothetical protein
VEAGIIEGCVKTSRAEDEDLMNLLAKYRREAATERGGWALVEAHIAKKVGMKALGRECSN